MLEKKRIACIWYEWRKYCIILIIRIYILFDQNIFQCNSNTLLFITLIRKHAHVSFHARSSNLWIKHFPYMNTIRWCYESEYLIVSCNKTSRSYCKLIVSMHENFQQCDDAKISYWDFELFKFLSLTNSDYAKPHAKFL